MGKKHETIKLTLKTKMKQLRKNYPRCTVHALHNDVSLNMEGSKSRDIVQEREQKICQALHHNLLAIKYLHTVHNNHNK